MSDLWLFVVVVLVGIALGYVIPVSKRLHKALTTTQFLMLFVLMFLMGLTIGQDPLFTTYIGTVGIQAFVMALSVMAGSVAMTLLTQKLFFRRGRRFDLYHEKVDDTPRQSMLRLTLLIIACMLVGYGAVVFARDTGAVQFLLANNSRLVFLFLCVMVFTAGLDIGLHKSFLSDIRKSGWAILIVPLGTVLGSIGGAMLAGLVMGVAPLQAGAAGSGCGWYTLSGLVLSNIEPRLGALAFLCNLMREILTPLATPFVSKRFGPFAAVSPAGATSMDTMLGIITRSTSPAMAIIAFSNGAILSSIIPGILTLFQRLL